MNPQPHQTKGWPASPPPAGTRTHPHRRGVASPATVRTRIRLRSNSASNPKTSDTHRPPSGDGVEGSLQQPEPHPRSANPRSVSTRRGNDGPNRPSRHTTRVSPGPNASITAASSRRSVVDPKRYRSTTGSTPPQ